MSRVMVVVGMGATVFRWWRWQSESILLVFGFVLIIFTSENSLDMVVHLLPKMYCTLMGHVPKEIKMSSLVNVLNVQEKKQKLHFTSREEIFKHCVEFTS